MCPRVKGWQSQPEFTGKPYQEVTLPGFDERIKKAQEVVRQYGPVGEEVNMPCGGKGKGKKRGGRKGKKK